MYIRIRMYNMSRHVFCYPCVRARIITIDIVKIIFMCSGHLGFESFDCTNPRRLEFEEIVATSQSISDDGHGDVDSDHDFRSRSISQDPGAGQLSRSVENQDKDIDDHDERGSLLYN